MAKKHNILFFFTDDQRFDIIAALGNTEIRTPNIDELVSNGTVFTQAHDPRSMPEEFLNMYDPEKISLPENFMEAHPFEFGISTIRDEVLAPQPRTPESIKRHIAEYYGMISHLDHEVGKVIDALKKSGQYDNTIIVFAGDNGLALGQHGLMGKQSNYEHSVRVPLIFTGPGIPRNEINDAYVYLLDIFPTLCDLEGIEIPQSVEGVSLLPCIRGTRAIVRENLYFAFEDSVRGIKDGDFKLIEYRSEETCRTQLFNLKNDPREINNLYEQAGYQEIISKLREELLKHRDLWDDAGHTTGKKFWCRY